MGTNKKDNKRKRTDLIPNYNQNEGKNDSSNCKNIKKIWIRGLIVMGMVIMLIFLCFGAWDNKIKQILNDNFLAAVLSIYIIFVFVINFSRSEKVEKITEIVQKKGTINSLLTTITLVSLVTISMTTKSNQLYEKQVEIENRETAPALSLTSEDNCYMVENEKGMASYMTFHIYERYNFMYKGEAYEASLLILYQKEDDTSDLTDKNKKVIFESADIEFDREKSFVALKNYLYIKTGENIDISNTRELDLSFYDYKNEGHTFEYHEYEGEIHLVSTEKNDFAPSHNVTVIVRDEAQLEEQIEYAVDCLI